MALLACVTLPGTPAGASAAEPADVMLNEGTVLRFAKAREGADLLKQDDRYLNAQSPLDRQLRRQTDRGRFQDAVCRVSSEQALAWLAPQREAITQATASLGGPFERMASLVPAGDHAGPHHRPRRRQLGLLPRRDDRDVDAAAGQSPARRISSSTCSRTNCSMC